MAFDRTGFDRDVGARLQRMRKARGITQEELAQRIGVPRPSYANIESGRQRIPIDIVWRAAVVLRVKVDALVPSPRNSKPHLAPVTHLNTHTVRSASDVITQEWSPEFGEAPSIHEPVVRSYWTTLTTEDE